MRFVTMVHASWDHHANLDDDILFVNSPIQGSAADLIKVAMINVHKALHADLPHVKMILQVHDELIFEVPETELDEAKHLVKEEMEGVGKQLGLSVPLKVDLGVGKNWRAAHP